MEWGCNIPVGKTRLKVEFTGGVLTQYGNTPAKFTTDDMLKQAIIENSKQFKNGKIYLVSSIISNEEETRKIEGRLATSNDNDTREADNDNADDNEQNTDTDNDNETHVTGQENVVEVTSLDDAKGYLNQKHGVPVRSLRSRQAIIDAAKEYGIVFKGV